MISTTINIMHGKICLPVYLSVRNNDMSTILLNFTGTPTVLQTVGGPRCLERLRQNHHNVNWVRLCTEGKEEDCTPNLGKKKRIIQMFLPINAWGIKLFGPLM